MTYDAAGDLLSMTYISGVSDTNIYNALGQLTMIDTYKTSSGTIAHLIYTYTYDSGGLQQTVTDQNNNKTTYTYDALDRLTQASTVPSGATNPSRQYAYTYDGNGNILQNALTGTAVAAATTSYKYNSANEICWAYPGANPGNACSSTPSGGYGYSYDANGNETSNGNGTSYSYNALSQMTGATVNDTTSSYSYIGADQTNRW